MLIWVSRGDTNLAGATAAMRLLGETILLLGQTAAPLYSDVVKVCRGRASHPDTQLQVRDFDTKSFVSIMTGLFTCFGPNCFNCISRPPLHFCLSVVICSLFFVLCPLLLLLITAC
jgi:hypothetical protein